MAALDRINQRFYSSLGEEFSTTRLTPWPAWARVMDRYTATRKGAHPSDCILDVGCGNGRFAAFVDARSGDNMTYMGLERSPVLAARARRGGNGARLVVSADLVNAHLPLRRRSRHFDLIVAFGVLHHVPSWELRRSLLVELAAHLRQDGMLAVSFWQFGAEQRFTGRVVDWTEFNETVTEPVDSRDLEPGDCLLRWGNGDAVRYCHFVDPVEAAELTAASGLARVETFHGDGKGGRLNLYHLLQHPSPPDV